MFWPLLALLACPLRAAQTERAAPAAPAPLTAPQLLARHVGFELSGLTGDPESLADGITRLTASYLTDRAPHQRLTLKLLGRPARDAARGLAAAGVEPAAAQRLAGAVAAIHAAATPQQPRLRHALTAAHRALQQPPSKAAEAPIYKKVRQTVGQVVSSWSSPRAAGPGSASLPDPGSLAFGDGSFKRIALPSAGDDVPKLWVDAHLQGPKLLQGSYDFSDSDIAQSIVRQAQSGVKQVLVGDYSNWFPQRGIAHRSPAMRSILDYLDSGGQNLELYILKGLGRDGINHNKFSLFYRGSQPNVPPMTADEGPGQTLLEGGSYNYTKASEENHWEEVSFTEEPERIAAFLQYFQWLTRRARKFQEGLAPEDPKFDPSDPIPKPAAGGVFLRGAPYPVASFSPDGGTEDWLVEMLSGAQKTIHMLMFAPFPTPRMVQAIKDALARGVELILVADPRQAGHATQLAPLIDAGLKLYTILGPDVVLQHQSPSSRSMMHEKVIVVDGAQQDANGQPAGLAKAGSLNISHNALYDSFENTTFWDGVIAGFLEAHFQQVLALATPADEQQLQQLRDDFKKEQAQQQQASLVAPQQDFQPELAGEDEAAPGAGRGPAIAAVAGLLGGLALSQKAALAAPAAAAAGPVTTLTHSLSWLSAVHPIAAAMAAAVGALVGLRAAQSKDGAPLPLGEPLVSIIRYGAFSGLGVYALLDLARFPYTGLTGGLAPLSAALATAALGHAAFQGKFADPQNSSADRVFAAIPAVAAALGLGAASAFAPLPLSDSVAAWAMAATALMAAVYSAIFTPGRSPGEGPARMAKGYVLQAFYSGLALALTNWLAWPFALLAACGLAIVLVAFARELLSWLPRRQA